MLIILNTSLYPVCVSVYGLKKKNLCFPFRLFCDPIVVLLLLIYTENKKQTLLHIPIIINVTLFSSKKGYLVQQSNGLLLC